MTTATPGWELYRSFLAVVREGSLSGAARTLSLTQPTIGRHMDALEEALGISLFIRSPSGLRPTPEAGALVPHAEAMSSAASALLRTASGEAAEERGAARLTASEIIGLAVLPSCLATFREAHPRIDIELVLSNKTQDLSRREADVAVRMVRPTQSALFARKAGTIRLGLHAHPAYLARHGTPSTVADLPRHTLIGFDQRPSVSRLPDSPVPLRRELFGFRCDNDYGQFAAIRAGFGIGVCQVALGRREGLLPVLPGFLEFTLPVWVVMHEDGRSTRRLRLLFDHLVHYLKAYVSEERG